MIYKYFIVCIHNSSFDRHLDGFHFLAIVNGASVNMGMQKETVFWYQKYLMLIDDIHLRNCSKGFIPFNFHSNNMN